ncbi:ADP-ribosyltransferase [Streptomyces sp. BBFR51]|uniref:ADP-ribosyltransferase n=1 Tax=Streptomyces sp. BBFR51 TaxID=3372856 RepID=UPI0037DCEF65
MDKTLSPEDAEWLFASAKLPHASVMHMEDGSVMLSASTRAEWTASDGVFSRSRYDLQRFTSPGGIVTAGAIRKAFAGTGVLTAAAGDADSGLVLHEQKSGEILVRITRARLRGATLVSMPAFKNARIVLDPLDETAAAAPATVLTAAGETRDRLVVYVCTSPVAVGARDVSRALGIAMSTARGHLSGAAKDGRIVRLSPGLYCGPSTMPEGHAADTTASAHIAEDKFHGTKGRPSYRKYHPSGRNARDVRLTQHSRGGWLGSNRFTEAQHEDTMLDYQGRAYRDMNSLLRSGAEPQRATLDETRHQITALEDLISIQEPFAAETTLYRGTRQLRLGLEAGDVFHDKGFSGTSEDEDVASSMTGVGGSLFRITAPEGTQALSVVSVGADNAEGEFILPPGTQFRVTAANEPKDELQQAVYDVEIINGRMAAAAHTGRAETVTAASGQFEDRMTEWDRETLVIDRPASAAPVAHGDLDSEVVASFWREMQDLPPMPVEWFREPTVEELPPGSEGVHVEGGRIFGWVAQAGVPHAGYPGKNLTIEKLARLGLDLTHFLRSRFALDDGSTVKCGVITMNVGHHRDGAECETDACLWDDTRTVAGIVTIGMSEDGLWFAGAANPKMGDWDRGVFKGCQPSYHLRQGSRGKWELRAVLSVPTPGHSSPLLVAAVVERTNLALTASAAVADAASGRHQDAVRTASDSSTDGPADQPGLRRPSPQHSPTAPSSTSSPTR